MKRILDKTIDVLGILKEDIITTMEDLDSSNWHHEMKYANADLNALFVLIASTQSYAKQLLETHADIIENHSQSDLRLKGK